MSSVTQVKFEIKPASKSVNTGKSIGSVAKTGNKKDTSALKSKTTRPVEVKPTDLSTSSAQEAKKGDSEKELRHNSCSERNDAATGIRKSETAKGTGNGAKSPVTQPEKTESAKDVSALKTTVSNRENEGVKNFFLSTIEPNRGKVSVENVNNGKIDAGKNNAKNVDGVTESLCVKNTDAAIFACNDTILSGNIGAPGARVNTGQLISSSLKSVKLNNSSSVKKNNSQTTNFISSPRDEKITRNTESRVSSSVKVKNDVTVNSDKANKSDTKVDQKSEIHRVDELVEKKLTNPERQKMLAHGLKEEILQKGNEILSGKGKTMDQEKKMDLDEETSLDGNVVEIKITEDAKDEPVKYAEPANMIDELQSYLLKRFGPVMTNNIQDSQSTSKFDAEKTEVSSDKKIENTETGSVASVKANSEQARSSTEAKKTPVKSDSFIPHPIFFKTSIKKDPGSKLHDKLLQELGSVLKKKNGKEDSKTSDKENENEDDEKGIVKFPKRRVSAKGNKILGNKALLANLENQLQRTLHKNKIFQRQKLKVVDLETIEVNDGEGHSSPSAEKNSDESNTLKSGAKLILDSQKLHANEEDRVTSAINELDKSINEHSEGSSQTESRILSEKGTSAKDIVTDGSENQEIFVYAFENKSGKTEGVVCSVEKRVSTSDSLGKPRKYLTCINIVAEKAADLEEGCPFTQDIADGGLPSASGSGLFFAEEDKPANFNVEVGRRKGDLRVSVSGPNSIAKCSVDPQADGSYTVTYIPVETGIFDISVTWNGTDIPGSPYHPKVVDARKVRIIGGWQHFMDSNERVNLVVGERKQLPFDISEAGPGSLRAEVKGPSRTVDVDIDGHTIGRAVVEFVPEEEGTHYIHIFWSDIPLVNSPFLGFAVQHTPDASKLILTGRGLKEAVVREEAEFVIDGSQAGKGTPDVVLSGVRAEVNVKVIPIGNGKFRCSYIPILPGAYLLHITWNGRQLRGSPYKVNVIGAFYPNRVAVSGVGGAILGREMNVGIDTRKAGPGELTAYCMGPHQVAYCELEDNHDGTFRLGVKAQESGRHVMQIKYGGEHVQGSPFVFKVTAQPDASKVRVHGPGVEHGILATYISRFIVETRGAGAGQLTVRIRGPKGAFQVEMYRDSQRDRTILCRFDPTECGLYIISVKWSGVDVPGSPFHVHILDTQEELEQVLNDVSYSFGTSHSHSHGGSQLSQHHQPRVVYSQWREQI